MAPEDSADDLLDAIVVGGGPAGLSAALVLGRCMRRVVVCDAGKPRNAAAKIFNGFLSRDGSTPGEFLEICRQQLRRYETVTLRKCEVVDVERGDRRFTVTLDQGDRLSARLLLLATGLVDELPTVGNFHRFYGKSVHSCPYCDGWEIRGQPVGVLGGSQCAADLAIELLHWSKDVVICADGPLECDARTRRLLEYYQVKVMEAPVDRLEGVDGDLECVRFRDGTALPRRAMFFSPAQRQQSPLAEKLGCQFCEEDGCIQCDETAATCIPGLYAAGNASRGVQLVIAAAAEGTLAAVAMNNSLIDADAASGDLKQA